MSGPIQQPEWSKLPRSELIRVATEQIREICRSYLTTALDMNWHVARLIHVHSHRQPWQRSDSCIWCVEHDEGWDLL